MQTFLPYPRFVDCARVLDDTRLGNQRNECYIVLETIVKSTTRPDKPTPKVPEGVSWMFGIRRDNSDLPWINHPCTRMWRDYRWALLCYSYTIIREWEARGYKDTTRSKFQEFGSELKQSELEAIDHAQLNRHQDLRDVYPKAYLLPHWLGNPLLHSSHRSKLLEKDETHYSQFGWDEELGMDYYWPV